MKQKVFRKMKYENIIKARFISRPNRFIAEVEIDGNIEIAHVKNTGRCKELLTEGTTVYVQKSDNPARKTKYDLITVVKNGMLINMDSQAPNKVFGEWVSQGNFAADVDLIKPECKYGNSRFDFYIEAGGRKIFAEIHENLGGNLRIIVSAAAPIDPKVGKWVQDIGITFLQGYG